MHATFVGPFVGGEAEKIGFKRLTVAAGSASRSSCTPER